MGRPASWWSIIAAAFGALVCAGILVLLARHPEALQGPPRLNLVSIVITAVGAAALDWAAFTRMAGSGVVAHGEDDPRYLDYANGRLAVVVLGAVITYAAASQEPRDDVLASVGAAMFLGGHIYVYWAVFRDLKNPPRREP